jgi:SrtB family sortase
MKKVITVLKMVIFITLAGIFLYTTTTLIGIGLEYKEGQDTYNDAAESVQLVTEEVSVTPIIVDNTTKPETEKEKIPTEPIATLEVDWSQYEEYPVCGWIQIQGNDTINYPVIQSEDNDFYLNHLYNGEWNKAGSAFIDKRNDGFANRHCIIYAHNMKDGSMFTSIKKYQEQSYADEHRLIFIGTPDGETKVFYVFSCFITDARGEDTYDAYQVSFDDTNDEWKSWLATTQEKSLITSGDMEIIEGGNVITLSTCTSRTEYERCVVHAVEILNEQPIEQ